MLTSCCVFEYFRIPFSNMKYLWNIRGIVVKTNPLIVDVGKFYRAIQTLCQPLSGYFLLFIKKPSHIPGIVRSREEPGTEFCSSCCKSSITSQLRDCIEDIYIFINLFGQAHRDRKTERDRQNERERDSERDRLTTPWKCAVFTWRVK